MIFSIFAGLIAGIVEWFRAEDVAHDRRAMVRALRIERAWATVLAVLVVSLAVALAAVLGWPQ